MQLIQDVFIMDNLQVIEEGSSNGKMKIRGTFQRAEEANNNGRIYPSKVLEGQISKLQPLIEERRLCGELDHPQNDTVKLSNASHLVTKLHMQGKEVIGEAEILKTPAGLTAQALVNGGVKIGISSRGMGTLSENSDGAKIVNEDFNLVTFDLVADPSTRGAFPGLSESRESQFVKTTQGKLKKESNFVTMLESKMREAYNPWIDEAKTKKKKKVVKGLDQSSEEMANGVDYNLVDKALGVAVPPEQLKAMLKNEAMELVKADGHWHRIAYALAEGLGKRLTPKQKKHIDKNKNNKIDAQDFKMLRTNEGLAELEGGGDKTVVHKEKKDREGFVSRALRQRSERINTEKMAVAKAKGEAEGAKIAGKARRSERLADVQAKGKESREGIRQATKTKRVSRREGEQREFDKTSLSRKAGQAVGKWVRDTNTTKGKPLRSGGKGVIKQKGKSVSKQDDAASSSSSETQGNPKKKRMPKRRTFNK